MSDTTLQIAIPKDIENLQLPSPELSLWWENALDRTFWIDFDVDETLLEIGRRIIKANKEDRGIEPASRKPITLFVWSYGGDLDSIMSFIDICALSKTPIITVNAGVAMSAGLLLLLAGHKRYCLSRSKALAHSGSISGMSGTYEQSESVMADYKKSIEVMRDYILERSGMDAKLLKKMQSKEWYMDSSEQISNGICHKVLTDLDVLG